MSKALSLILVGFCAGLLFEGLAQEPLISNRANLNKTLSIRLKPRNIKFERPSGSALKIGNLRSGVYVVRVQDKGATHTSKFILR